jgi:hypothetical protein
LLQADGRTVIGEVNMAEATLNPSFSAASFGPFSYKGRQVASNVWMSLNLPRQNYTSETQLNYIIFAPKAPVSSTRDFLNDLMDDFANLQILWVVVGK